jgi:DNA-binding NarL/FixJ family response regulator
VSDANLRVLIADDQALVRAGFRMILEVQPDIEVIAEAADGEAAVRLARRQRPDVVLMDIRMPGVDGLEATRRLLGKPGTDRSAAAPPVHPPRIVILTTFDLDEYVYAAPSRPERRGSCSRTSRPNSSSLRSERSRSATPSWRHRSPGDSSSASPGRRRSRTWIVTCSAS